MIDRLEQCPRCDYSLEGLPAAHACPECGLAYDEHSFRYIQRPWRGWLVMYGVIFALGAAGKVLEISRLGPPSAEWFGPVGLLLVFGIMAFSAYRISKRGMFVVAILPEGIHYEQPPHDSKLVRWEKITAISAGSPGNLRVMARVRRSMPLVLMTRFWRHRDTDAFAARVLACRERYRRMSSSEAEQLTEIEDG